VIFMLLLSGRRSTDAVRRLAKVEEYSLAIETERLSRDGGGLDQITD
jgi:hypothetical protein